MRHRKQRPVHLTALALALAALAAGCLAPPVKESAQATPTDPAPEPDLAPRGEGCSGFSLDAAWPARHPRAHVPDGWDAQSGPSTIRLEGWACERLSWGAFERGPVRLVFEMHDQQVTPEPCRHADRTTNFHVLQSLWIDDAGMAAWLQGQGIPARFAAIDFQEPDAGPGVLRWSWGDAAGDIADVRLPTWDDYVLGTPQTRRLFWDDGARLTAMDVVSSRSPPGAGSGPDAVIGRVAAVGLFAPPMLLGDLPAPQAMPATPFQDGQWAGTLIHYGDLQCAPMP